jgi:PIN domain nuclease of toxin-antitoxin system
VVLDASAILALLNEEPGADEVEAALAAGGCLVGAVNWSEVLSRLFDLEGAQRGALDAVLDSLLELLTIVPFEAADAVRAAELRPETRQLGLSLGDRACLALAQRAESPVLTADRVWEAVDVAVRIRLLR